MQCKTDIQAWTFVEFSGFDLLPYTCTYKDESCEFLVMLVSGRGKLKANTKNLFTYLLCLDLEQLH